MCIMQKHCSLQFLYYLEVCTAKWHDPVHIWFYLYHFICRSSCSVYTKVTFYRSINKTRCVNEQWIIEVLLINIMRQVADISSYIPILVILCIFFCQEDFLPLWLTRHNHDKKILYSLFRHLEASEPNWVNSDYISYGVNSTRLGGLFLL